MGRFQITIWTTHLNDRISVSANETVCTVIIRLSPPFQISPPLEHEFLNKAPSNILPDSVKKDNPCIAELQICQEEGTEDIEVVVD